jgi:hypothetical protein
VLGLAELDHGLQVMERGGDLALLAGLAGEAEGAVAHVPAGLAEKVRQPPLVALALDAERGEVLDGGVAAAGLLVEDAQLVEDAGRESGGRVVSAWA